MRRASQPVLLALLAPLVLACCGGSPVGRWVCDSDGMVAQAHKVLQAARAEAPDDGLDRVDEILAPLVDRVRLADSTFELRADGTCRFAARTRTAAMSAEGTWRLDGGRLTMAFDGDGEEPPFTIAGTFDGDCLSVVEERAAREVRTRFRRSDR